MERVDFKPDDFEYAGMITAYLWGTPNGYKLAIALEEMDLEYEVRWVDIGKGELFSMSWFDTSWAEAPPPEASGVPSSQARRGWAPSRRASQASSRARASG